MKFLLRSVLAATLFALSAAAHAGVFVSVTIAPPPLPVYAQPPCPDEGYIWTPGYWAYDYDYEDYYWVPGTWVLAPEPGYLWTPGWWGWENAVYLWHPGYWGPHVGFYGGINYGYGYGGDGYYGGRWEHDRFHYNTAVNNVNVTNVHNTYNSTVINNVTVNRVSYNGGSGGIDRRPGATERDAAREHHFEATRPQAEHEHAAREDRAQFVSANHGRPDVAATPRPGIFSDRNVMHAKPAGDENFRRENHDHRPDDRLSDHAARHADQQRPEIPQPVPHSPAHQPLPDSRESSPPHIGHHDLAPNPNPVIPDEQPRFERYRGPRHEERVLPSEPVEPRSPPNFRGPSREVLPMEREHQAPVMHEAPPRIERQEHFERQAPMMPRAEPPHVERQSPAQFERAPPPRVPVERGPGPAERSHAGRHEERDEGRR